MDTDKNMRSEIIQQNRRNSFSAFFDSNFYIGTTWSEIQSLCESEQRVGNLVFANPFVVLELLAHLSIEEQSRSHASALKKLIQHCSDENGIPRVLEDTVTMVERELLHTPSEHMILHGYSIFEILIQTRDARLLLGNSSLEPVYAHARQFLQDSEVQFLQQLNSIKQDMSRPWLKPGFLERMLLLDVVNSASDQLGTIPKQRNLFCQIGQLYRAAFTMWRNILEKCYNPSSNSISPKMRNFLIDRELCFLISNEIEMAGMQLVAVTNDKAIRTAACLSGCGNRCISFEEYHECLRSLPLLG